jgi:hypothetical protein
MIFSMALESANRGLTPMRGSSAGSRRRSPILELARVLVRLNHAASFIVNANHSIM